MPGQPVRRRRVTRRVSFTQYATAVLTTAYGISPTPTKEQRLNLADAIGTTERRVQVWFQNRRQRANVSSAAEAAAQPSDANDDAYDELADASENEDTEDAPYPVSESSAPSVVMHEPSAVPPPSPVTEGCPAEDMKMEAFTTLFPPFEVRATPTRHSHNSNSLSSSHSSRVMCHGR